MKKIIFLLIFQGIIITAYCQNLKKAYSNIFEGYNMENQVEQGELFAKSIEIFNKAVEKDSTNASAWFGLSVIYAIRNYTHKDYFQAWKYFQLAEKYKENITGDDLELLNQYFVLQDLKRRNKKLEDNIHTEKLLLEDKLIRHVREENDLNMAHRFITEYPESNYLDNVIHIRNYLEYRQAEKKNTLEGFREFIATYPEAAQVAIATKNIETLSYEKVKSSNDLNALNQFIEEFPGSENYFSALKYRDLLAFNQAKQDNTIESYEAFLSKYPDAMQYAEAKLLKMKLVFEKAKNIQTLEAFEAFVEKYPEGEQYVDIINLKATVLGNEVIKNSIHDLQGINWIKGFDLKNQDDIGCKILQDVNNEILILGSTSDRNTDNTDILYIKLDNQGRMLWNQQLGDTLNEKLSDMDLLGSDGFVCAGRHQFNDTLPGKAWIIGAGIDGSNAWNRNTEIFEHTAIKALSDTGFYTGGVYFSEDSIAKAYLSLMKTNGKTIWKRYYTFQGKVNDLQTDDSNMVYLTAGNRLLKVDQDGYIQWEKIVESANSLNKIFVAHDQLYFIETLNDSAHFINCYDLQGGFLWRNLVSEIDHTVDDLLVTDEQIIVSETISGDIKLVWYDLSGNKTKEEITGTSKNESKCRIIQAGDGSLLMMYTLEYRPGDQDIIILNRFL